MLNFQCPSCQSKCSVDDQFRGRKLKCPKCRTRIRHHLDGTIELLSLGDPPPPASAGSPGAGKPTTRAVPVQESAPPPPVAAVVNKFTSQSESKQNKMILWGIGAILGLAILAYSLINNDMLVLVGAIALVLVCAFGFLFVRNQALQIKAAAASPPASPKNPDETQPAAPSVPAPVAAAPVAAAPPAPAPPLPPPPPPPAPAPAPPPAGGPSPVEDDAPTDHLTIIE